MQKSLLNDIIVHAETFQNDRIGTLAVDSDFAIGAAEDSTHALSGGIELANGKKLVLQLPPVDFNSDRTWLARNKLVAHQDCTFHKSTLVR